MTTMVQVFPANHHVLVTKVDEKGVVTQDVLEPNTSKQVYHVWKDTSISFQEYEPKVL